MPFLIQWPGKVTKGREVNVLTSGVDVLPTLAAIAGVAVEDTGVQGVNILPDILGSGSSVPSDRVLHTHLGRWLSSEDLPQHKDTFASVFDKQYRMVWDVAGTPALYDYVNDPGEEQDIISEYPQIVEKFTKLHDVWWELACKEMVNDLEQARLGKYQVQKVGKHHIFYGGPERFKKRAR